MDRVTIDTINYENECEANDAAWEMSRNVREDKIYAETTRIIEKEPETIYEDGYIDSPLSDLLLAYRDFNDATNEVCKESARNAIIEAALVLGKHGVGLAEKIARDDVEANWDLREWL